MNAVADPFVVLQDMAVRYERRGANLPMQAEAKEVWTAVGFRLGKLSLLAPLGEVSEIFKVPSLTRVPLSKNWVRGVANVRGTLLPVMDLNGFLHGTNTTLTPDSRILTIRIGEFSSGVLVEEVLGLRHFEESERTSVLPAVGESIRPYLTDAYWRDDEYWGVFSMRTLLASRDFLQVAV